MTAFAQKQKQTHRSHFLNPAKPGIAALQPAHASKSLLTQQYTLGTVMDKEFGERDTWELH